uniref:Reverse transcriptase domain-containing protein n=1 Tax=Plectus sambesii TaxID=2011161 RepID=A0A914VYJ5_9BILA
MPYVTIDVPLTPPHNCHLCLPVPRQYVDHHGLAKHLSKEHVGYTLDFRCVGCHEKFGNLKSTNTHIKSTTCSTTIAARPAHAPPPTLPLRRIQFRPRVRNAAAASADADAEADADTITEAVATVAVIADVNADAEPSSQLSTPPRRVLRQRPAPPMLQPSSSSKRSSSSSSSSSSSKRSSSSSSSSSSESSSSSSISSGSNTSVTEQQQQQQPQQPATPAPQAVIPDRPAAGPPPPATAEQLAWARRFNSIETTEDLEATLAMLITEVTNSTPTQTRPAPGPAQPARPPGARHQPQTQGPAGHPQQPPMRPAPQQQVRAPRRRSQIPLPAGPPQQLPTLLAPQQAHAPRHRSLTPRPRQEPTLPPPPVLPPRPTPQPCRPDAAALQRRRRHSGPEYVAAEASRLQKLYRVNRPKAFREVTSPPSAFCNIDQHRVQAHFTQVLQRRHHLTNAMPTSVPQLTPPPLHDADPLNSDFTPAEVRNRLTRCKNTAPGPDKLRYTSWKTFDPSGSILSAVYNAAQRLQHVPAAWKESTTILLYKDGDRDNISNWRPIALSDTIGKLYASCLAARLTNWCLRYERISPTQKGFMPYEGCLEHNFVLQSCIQDARSSRRTCTIAWLDLRNAFGSVPHDTLFKCLRWTGLSTASIDAIRRLYTDCSTAIRVNEGLTESIAIGAGVKQGCPLSPIVFNLTIEPILRAVRQLHHAYKIHDQEVDVLAYADDLALVSDSADGLQALLDVTATVASWAGLSFNPKKCASLHINGKKHNTPDTSFNIQGNTMQALNISNFYKHLGVPTGFTLHSSASSTLKEIADDVHKLDESLLAPWQKFDATNVFVLSRLSFHLKAGVVPKGPLIALDKQIKAVGKRWLHLPQRASVEPLYLSYKAGGVNLLPLGVLADVAQVTHALRLLTSIDPAVRQLSLSALLAAVKKRTRRDVQETDVADYLNGSMEGVFRQESTAITSIWSRLRVATRRLRTKLNISWQHSGDNISLFLDDATVTRKPAESQLRDAVRNHYLQRLLAKPDQGKVYDVTASTPASNHYMRNGNFTRFAEWRFIHRARLGVVPLNGCRRFGTGDKRCRRCGEMDETLPHVLNHCRPHFATMTRRHDAILDRLEKATRRAPGTTIRRNQQVPGCNSTLRPDLVLINETEKTFTIVDVTVPFENRSAAFTAARVEKARKYADITQHYADLGYDASCNAFIIGSLGGYDPANGQAIARLGIGHRYAVLMKRLMVTDTIRWSRDIYIEHVSGHRQY